jgi:zinc transporter 1/2/3
MTGHWADYSWVAGIVQATVILCFLLEFGIERYVDKIYGYDDTRGATESVLTKQQSQGHEFANNRTSITHNQLYSNDQDKNMHETIAAVQSGRDASAIHSANDVETRLTSELLLEKYTMQFRRQFAAFLVLEFGIIFHSVIMGLNLATTGTEFKVLFPVIVFHRESTFSFNPNLQCYSPIVQELLVERYWQPLEMFEGLGIGARMSAIPFPPRYHMFPWLLCLAYALTTPIAMAAGLGIRTTYNASSYTANQVSGILDAMSAGILIYTALVELIARDFMFNKDLTRDTKRQVLMVLFFLLGSFVMSLLGKWA